MVDIHMLFRPWNFWKILTRRFWEIGVWNFWADAHFSSSTTWGGLTPDLTRDHYSPGGPDKNGFWMAGIGSHLGEIWGFENFTFCHIWPQISQNLLIRIPPFSRDWKKFLCRSDMWKITKIDSSEVSRFWGQIIGKIKIAKIILRGTMFDSAYVGYKLTYSRYFKAVDSPSTCPQGDQKSSLYGWKCPHYRRSNLLDRSIYDTCRARDHVWLPISRNPEVRTSKFCSSPQNFLRPSDVWKITKIDSSEVSRFQGQSTGKNQNSRNCCAWDHVWLPISRPLILIFQTFYSDR